MPEHPERYEELDFDLQLDALEEEVGDQVVPPEEVVEAMRDAERLLAAYGIPLPPLGGAHQVGRPSRRFPLQFPPSATLAAADLVKATVRWDGGVVRLLHSPLRPDLAAEVTIDEQRRVDFSGCVFLLSLDAGEPLALLADVSPVFCGLGPDHFRDGRSGSIEAVSLATLSAAQAEKLRNSRRNLRDPLGLAAYDLALAQVSGSGR